LFLLLLMSRTGDRLGGELLKAVGGDLPAAVTQKELTLDQCVAIGWASSTFLVRAASMILAGSVVLGLSAHISQVGFQLTPKALEWKPERLSPASGLKKIFSLRGFMRTGMAMGKFLICSSAMAVSCYYRRDVLLTRCSSLSEGVSLTWDLCLHVGIIGSLALMVLGAADFAFQRWQHEDSIKMTKQEVKEEAKENEGDAQIRGKIRKLQREAAKQRSLKEVPSATVVITNPTHYAIAIRYDRDTMAAPRVVAKGKGHLAQRIKKKAAEAGIPQFERKSVARALYATAEIGSDIPIPLYRAVAEILAYVYGLKKAS